MQVLLEGGGCIPKLAEKLMDGINKLVRRTSNPDISNPKFRQGTELAYGQLSSFFDGLEGIVGPPSVSLQEAIEREHCTSSDSTELFEAQNYGTKTCSCIEYHFVHYGADGVEMVEKNHPKARHLLVEVPSKDGRTLYQYPAEKQTKLTSGAKPRTSLSYTELEAKLMGKNDELVQLGSQPMGKQEFLSARMYTGPVRGTAPYSDPFIISRLACIHASASHTRRCT